MNSIAADRAVERTFRISEAIGEAESTVAYHVDVALDALVSDGCFPSRFAASAERNDLCKRAAKAALAVVLAEANLPAEIEHLHCAEAA